LAQTGRFNYANLSKEVAMAANDGRVRMVPKGFQVLLTGNVVATDSRQGLDLRAQRVTADLVGTSKQSELRRAVAEGGVRIVKTAGGGKGSQTTRIEGQRADYRTTATEATVDLAGPVTIRSVNAAKKETMVATGSRGRAILAPGNRVQASGPLRQAELTGSVRVNVVQARENGRFVATARRMTLVMGAKTRTITLLDDVDVQGQGAASVFSAEGQRKFVMVLNEAGEVVEWSADSR
jgi:uncharacterized protein YaiE (UPF0345 family)